MVKRLFDIVVASIMLAVLALPMLIIAILIKCDSRGPVFFRQERVTQYGRIFKIYKFRTMVVNANELGASVTVDIVKLYMCFTLVIFCICVIQNKDVSLL